MTFLIKSNCSEKGGIFIGTSGSQSAAGTQKKGQTEAENAGAQEFSGCLGLNPL
jgi:hypothetical protein